MEFFLLGFIIGEIITSYISPIVQALGELILLNIEKHKSYLLSEIKIINDEIEEDNNLSEDRRIGFSTEVGDYKNGNDNEEEKEDTTEEKEQR